MCRKPLTCDNDFDIKAQMDRDDFEQPTTGACLSSQPSDAQ